MLQRQFVNHVKLVKKIYFCDNAHFFLIYVVLFKWSKQLDTVDLQILLFTEKWTAYEASIIARGNYITYQYHKTMEKPTYQLFQYVTGNIYHGFTNINY